MMYVLDWFFGTILCPFRKDSFIFSHPLVSELFFRQTWVFKKISVGSGKKNWSKGGDVVCQFQDKINMFLASQGTKILPFY